MALETRPPPHPNYHRSNYFHFLAVFGKKSCKIIRFAPNSGLGATPPPRLGNPGSATTIIILHCDTIPIVDLIPLEFLLLPVFIKYQPSSTIASVSMGTIANNQFDINIRTH